MKKRNSASNRIRRSCFAATALLHAAAVCILWSTLPAAADEDEGIGPCYDVPAYEGINAVPEMTMQSPDGETLA